MRERPNLEEVSDDKLLRGLFEVSRQSRHDEANLIAHIAEVDARKLYAREAAPSMFAWCTETLHLSEAEAYLRIAVARASRRHPKLLAMLADGRLHLSGIERLAPHLTEKNRDALLKRAVHKSKRQIEEMIAELRPAPAAPALVRRLPKPGSPNVASNRSGAAASGAEPGPAGLFPPGGERLSDAEALTSAGHTRTSGTEQRPDAVALVTSCYVRASGDELRPDAVTVADPVSRLPVVPGRSAAAATMRKLPARCLGPEARVTALSELRMDGVAAVPPELRPAGVGTANGRPASDGVFAPGLRHDLDFHHRKAFGFGGDHSPEKLVLMCRTHNALRAEPDFGREKMARSRRRASRVPEPDSVTPVQARGQTGRATHGGASPSGSTIHPPPV